MFHGALGYAAEAGLLAANPLDRVAWRAPGADPTVSPQVVASPAQVHAILAEVSVIRPELAAFFGCLYYAALRPEEAVALRDGDCALPPRGWGTLVLARACPRTGSAWTSTGSPHEPRGLKHRSDGAVRAVPIPPVLVTLLRRHLRRHGTTRDGRLFRGARGGMLSESLYGRTWHTARAAALGPDLAAGLLARRPYDLRHAALSLWLTSTGSPAEVAARAGNSPRVLYATYVHCIHGHHQIASQQIERALDTGGPLPFVTASGSADRCRHPDPVRHLSVTSRLARARPTNRVSGRGRLGVPSILASQQSRTSSRKIERSEARRRAWSSWVNLAHAWPTAPGQAVCGPLAPCIGTTSARLLAMPLSC